MTVVEGDPFGILKPAKKDQTVSATVINRAHAKSDVDSSVIAQHHTLGVKSNQASPGDHKHDGRNSKKLLEGTTLTGSKATYNATLMGQVVDALEKLGATDSTT
ncbi:MAG: hypothetical protein ACREOB_07545 [Thermodesulfobacteriota bacterium]